MRSFLRAAVPVALGVAAAFGVAAAPAASASTQFSVTFVRGNLIQTSHYLYVGEVLHVGLDGQAFTVQSKENLGGTTLAWVSPTFSFVLDGKTVTVTAS